MLPASAAVHQKFPCGLKHETSRSALILTQFHRKVQEQAHKAEQQAERGGAAVFPGGNGVEDFQGKRVGAARDVSAEHEAHAHFAKGSGQAEKQSGGHGQFGSAAG